MTTADRTVTNQRQALKKHRKLMVRANAGVAFEYYDYAVFAVFSPFFASQFFVRGDNLSAVLDTLLVFAVGFVSRPIGSILSGRLSDRFGRTPLMMAGLALSSLGSFAIALTPTHRSIGIAAVVILVISRLAQGFGHGVEQVSAVTYVAEIADRKRRAFQTSFYQLSLSSGLVLAQLLGVVLTTVFTDDQLREWVWRIPFLLGGAFALLVVVLRRTMVEPESFSDSRAQAAQEDAGYWSTIWKYRGRVGVLMLLWPAVALGYYTFAVGYPQFAITVVGADSNAAFWAGFIALLLYLITLPFWGRLADAKGRRFNYTLALGGSIVLAIPLQMLLGPSFWQLVVPMGVGLVLFGCLTSTETAMNTELLPNKVRAQVMSIPASLAAVLFGGTAPYLRTWMDKNVGVWTFTGYVIVLFVVALATVRRLPETRGRDLAEDGYPVRKR